MVVLDPTTMQVPRTVTDYESNQFTIDIDALDTTYNIDWNGHTWNMIFIDVIK